MRRKKICLKTILPSILLLLLFPGSCVSARQKLAQAADAWQQGRYSQAVEFALEAYSLAAEKNKPGPELAKARRFLEERFEQANNALSRLAESQLNSPGNKKTEAWKIYLRLVEMNRKAADSPAASFLSPRDFSTELAQAKETAAELLYGQVLERIEEDRHKSYIEAVKIIDEIETIIPGYRLIRTLRTECIETGKITVAFSSSPLIIQVKGTRISSLQALQQAVYAELERFIISRDHPEFLSFISPYSYQDALDRGADYYIELGGQISINASKTDDYIFNGTVTWNRSVSGAPKLSVTYIPKHRLVSAAVPISINHSVKIEFYPASYNTKVISAHLFDSYYGNSLWMNQQLSNVKNALKSNHASVKMVLWAEMEFSNRISFLTTAEILNGNSDGSNEIRSIPWEVYYSTEQFLEFSQSQFLSFGDYSLTERLTETMVQNFINNAGIQTMLGEL
ncbi:MAG: hypothetical protein B0D92_05755 [Spirochaeta sp. LUC14_002_19_P3]|nr:MAG: hypothetical protein B0D92_05755 [Spirochaeta sp. LUC14_002_19_P3]